jgi:hypothetical protein
MGKLHFKLLGQPGQFGYFSMFGSLTFRQTTFLGRTKKKPLLEIRAAPSLRDKKSGRFFKNCNL